MQVTFRDRLLAASRANGSLLCVGLDPEPQRLPAGLPATAAGLLAFGRAIIEATADLVCAFKPNSAFYEALGPAGMEALRATIAAVPAHIPVILDAKRGDIGTTAERYATAAFEALGATAITASPYLGGDALAPLLARADRGCFVLCRTSNPGGADLQELVLADGQPLYMHVAGLAATRWSGLGNCGLVVGATYPRELAAVRARCPELPILVPGVGAQGGDLAAATRAAVDTRGELAVISASRAIIYASTGADYAQAARAAAQQTRAAIQQALAG